MLANGRLAGFSVARMYWIYLILQHCAPFGQAPAKHSDLLEIDD
jgi:hypothetical protein